MEDMELGTAGAVVKPAAEVGHETKRGAKKKRPVYQLNTYDVLKVVAVVTMMIDHAGLFGFSHNLTLRLIGRVSAPIFYFLVGAALSYRLTVSHVGWALLLLAVNYRYGLIIPLNNSLNAILLSKFVLYHVPFHTLHPAALLVVLVVLVASHSTVQPRMEYGNMSLLHAIGGQLVTRHNVARFVWVPAACVFHFHICNKFYVHRHSQLDMMFGALTFTALTGVFLLFRLVTITPKSLWVRVGTRLLRWVSDHSLQIYVLHLIAYKFHRVHLQLDRMHHPS